MHSSGDTEYLSSELLSVPDDLRNVLEQCLAEDATPEHLELYLPTVRQIITNLLQGPSREAVCLSKDHVRESTQVWEHGSRAGR